MAQPRSINLWIRTLADVRGVRQTVEGLKDVEKAEKTIAKNTHQRLAFVRQARRLMASETARLEREAAAAQTKAANAAAAAARKASRERITAARATARAEIQALDQNSAALRRYISQLQAAGRGVGPQQGDRVLLAQRRLNVLLRKEREKAANEAHKQLLKDMDDAVKAQKKQQEQDAANIRKYQIGLVNNREKLRKAKEAQAKKEAKELEAIEKKHLAEEIKAREKFNKDQEKLEKQRQQFSWKTARETAQENVKQQRQQTRVALASATLDRPIESHVAGAAGFAGGGLFGMGGGGISGAIGGAVGGLAGTIGGLISALTGWIPIVGDLGKGIGLLVTSLGALGGAITTTILGAAEAAVPVLASLAGGIVAAGVTTLAAAGTMSVALNRIKENAILTLRAMAKTDDEAEQLYQRFSLFADLTPFNEQETIEAGRLIKTFGLQTAKAEKQLRNFGLQAGRMLEYVGDTAFAMDIPMEQVVRTLGALHSGILRMQQLAPLGISRDMLKAKGIKFDPTGRVENREQLLGAAMKVLEERFGGIMSRAGKMLDQLTSTAASHVQRFVRTIGTSLYSSIENALVRVNDKLSELLGIDPGRSIFDALFGSDPSLKLSDQGKKIVDALSVPFTIVGRAIEYVSKKFDGFVTFLARILDAKKIEYFTLRLIALFKTIGEGIFQYFGIDLSKIFDLDDKKVKASWDNALKIVWDSILTVVKFAFRIGAVFQEVLLIIQGGFQGTSNMIEDTWKTLGIYFDTFWQSLADGVTVLKMHVISEFKDMVGTIAESFGRLFENLPWWLGGGLADRLKGFAADLKREALDLHKKAGEAPAKFAKQRDTEQWQRFQEEAKRREERNKKQSALNTRSGMTFGQRIGGAYDLAFQDYWDQYVEFMKRLEKNYGWTKRNFGTQPDTTIAPPHDTFPAPGNNIYATNPDGSVKRDSKGRPVQLPGGASPEEQRRYNPEPPILPGMRGYEFKLFDAFYESIDQVKAWTDLVEKAVDMGGASFDDLFDAKALLAKRYLEGAIALQESTDTDQVTTQQKIEAWKDYFDAVDDARKAIEKAQEDALKYLKSRTSNIESFFGLMPEGSMTDESRQMQSDLLRQQRDILGTALMGETDPQKVQDILGQMLDVGKSFKDVWEDKGSFFGGRFNQQSDVSPLGFVLGGGAQANRIMDLIMHGSPGQQRLLDPMERTADNTARIAEMMAAARNANIPNLPNFMNDPLRNFGNPLVQPGAMGGPPAFSQVNNFNIQGADPETLQRVIEQVLQRMYNSARGQAPARRR